MDKSFGYNRYSRPEDHISANEISALIKDLHKRKGKLLLNVGPDENGNIPHYQQQILQALAKMRK